MIRMIIKGETPAKKNSKIWTRSGKLIPGKKYQEWHKDALKQVEDQKKYMQKLPGEQEVVIRLDFIHGDQRRRDSDNGTSSILDLLVDAGIIADDKWQIVRQLHVSNTYEKNDPMCIICIEPYCA